MRETPAREHMRFEAPRPPLQIPGAEELSSQDTVPSVIPSLPEPTPHCLLLLASSEGRSESRRTSTAGGMINDSRSKKKKKEVATGIGPERSVKGGGGGGGGEMGRDELGIRSSQA